MRELRAVALGAWMLLLGATGSTGAVHPADMDTLPMGGGTRFKQWFYNRLIPPGSAIPTGFRSVALAPEFQARPGAAPRGPAWTDQGPTAVPNGQLVTGLRGPVSGRALCFGLHPTDTSTVYVGTANGGVWKTVDGGGSWRPLTDDQASLAIGALAVDPTNASVVYAGTGEPMADSFCLNYYGAGLLKSVDAGATWTLLGQTEFALRGISAIAIDPTNTDVVYVCTSRGSGGSATLACTPLAGAAPMGLFKSVDGGATFTTLLTTPFGVDDVVLDPTSPLTLYVGLARIGVFKSTDGGASFVPLAGGLPATGFGRTDLSLDPTAPATLYVALDDFATDGRVFRSDDGGANFVELIGARGYCEGQCFYDMPIQAGPGGSLIIGGQTRILRSTNMGASFTDISRSGDPFHVDFHGISFHPANPNVAWVANDGGVWRSLDAGATWSNRNANLSTIQFISVAAHPTDPKTFIGGTQDNGTVKHVDARNWTNLQFGDGGATLIDPLLPDTYYHMFFNNNLERSDNAGQSWTCKASSLGEPGCFALLDPGSFYVPLEMDPAAPSTIHLGTFRVHRSTDRGNTFVPISPDLTSGAAGSYVTAIGPTGTGRIYAATNDGRVSVTDDSGGSWTLRTTGLPAGASYTGLAVDPADPAVAYVTIAGFGTGHVFRTANAGLAWTDISGNFPDLPALCIAVVDRSTLLVGSDIGVLVTRDGGAVWTLLDNAMPRCATFDLAVGTATNQVIAATHGRGMFSNQLRPTLSLTAPAAGERLVPGSTVTVAWSAVEGVAAESFASFDVHLSTDGGATFPLPIATGLPGSVRSAAFVVPASLRTLSARLRVQAKGAAGGLIVQDASAADSIVNSRPAIAATVPAQVLPRTPLTLDGSATTDADGDPLSFVWTQLGGPAVSFVANVPAPSFVTPDVERQQLDFRLAVSDGLENATLDRSTVVALTVLPAGQQVAGCTAAPRDRRPGPASGDLVWPLALLAALAGLLRRVRRGVAPGIAAALLALLAVPADARERALSEVLEHPESMVLFGAGSYHPRSSRAHGEIQFTTTYRFLVPSARSDEATVDGFEFSVGVLPTVFEDVTTLQVGALRVLERTRTLNADHHFFYGAGVGTARVDRRAPEATVVIPEVYFATGLTVRIRDFSVEAGARYVNGLRRSDYDVSGVMIQVAGAYYFQL